MIHCHIFIHMKLVTFKAILTEYLYTNVLVGILFIGNCVKCRLVLQRQT